MESVQIQIIVNWVKGNSLLNGVKENSVVVIEIAVAESDKERTQKPRGGS